MPRRTLINVGAIAAATLLLETTLTRFLAVAQYYHFAFLVVSLALLGFGASGSLLALYPRLYASPDAEGAAAGTPAQDRVLAYAGLAFAASAALAYAVINLLPFDSYSIAWDRRQIFLFALYYLVLTIPFICAGLGIGSALAAARGGSHLVYAANLAGSATGALVAPLALWLAGVPGAVVSSLLLGLLIPLFSPRAWQAGMRWGLRFLALACLVGLGYLTYTNWSGSAGLRMAISPYKGLAQAQRFPGASRLFGRWNAISRVDVLASAGTHLLPGLSYAYPGLPPPQHGLAIDAQALQPVSLVDPGDFEAAAYLPEALAFSLRPQARAVVLEPGGGLGVLQALAGGSREVLAVVENPLVLQAVSQSAPQQNPYAQPQVWTVVETPRVFLQSGDGLYDVIFLPLTDAYRPVTSGAYSLSETYNLTLEAFTGMLAQLSPDGLLVATRWLQTPPSESVRLIGTLAEALERRGMARPAEALVAYRGVQTMTVLVQPDGWEAEELLEVRRFTESRRYDLVWAPDIQPEETNRYNRLPQPVYYETMQELLGSEGRAAFYAHYPYAVTPATDDRPFFFHLFKWEQTPELLAALGRTWQPFGGSGYFVLLALLGLVTVLGGLLILAPLLARRLPARDLTQRSESPGLSRGRVVVYFTALGLAFLFVEIPLIQRWILLLGHPTYAFALVVVVLLSFSGLGSALARARWLPRRAAFALLVVLALLTPWLAASELRSAPLSALAWPLALRALAGGLSLAPLAVLMGLPFPLGLAWLEARAPQLVPWAWAVNGCASVVASVLAAILALSYGFTVVLVAGAGAYALAFVALAPDL